MPARACRFDSCHPHCRCWTCAIGGTHKHRYSEGATRRGVFTSTALRPIFGERPAFSPTGWHVCCSEQRGLLRERGCRGHFPRTRQFNRSRHNHAADYLIAIENARIAFVAAMAICALTPPPLDIPCAIIAFTIWERAEQSAADTQLRADIASERRRDTELRRAWEDYVDRARIAGEELDDIVIPAFFEWLECQGQENTRLVSTSGVGEECPEGGTREPSTFIPEPV